MEKLCQLNDKSCAGCCCIEVPEDSKDDLARVFRYRRDVFKRFLCGVGDIDGYQSKIATKEPLLSVDTLESTLEKKCHFLGFLNDEETKVGCLAHPMMNQGQDLRDCGFYKSSKTCQDFLCTAAKIYDEFSSRQKELFQLAIADWTWYELSDQEKVHTFIVQFLDRLEEIENADTPKVSSSEVCEGFRHCCNNLLK